MEVVRPRVVPLVTTVVVLSPALVVLPVEPVTVVLAVVVPLPVDPVAVVPVPEV